RADRRQGPCAPGDARRQGRLGARLPVPVRVRRGGKALGLQAAHHMGRRAGPLARARASQRRDGRDVPGRVPQLPKDAPRGFMTRRFWAALAEVQDPEMPINLVDLGVIYGISENHGVVEVDLTFTAMGCPASDFTLEGGSVVAPDDDLAMAYARATYDEERWCEMAIVRKDDVIRLWSPGEA